MYGVKYRYSLTKLEWAFALIDFQGSYGPPVGSMLALLENVHEQKYRQTNKMVGIKSTKELFHVLFLPDDAKI